MISAEEKEWLSEFMTDFWGFVKRYGDPTMDDDKADRMIHEANEMAKKYHEDRRVISTLTGFISGVDRVSR